MRSVLPAASLGGDESPHSSEWFRRLGLKTSSICGHPVSFGVAVAIVLLWAATGPLFRYSDTWQLVINTGTTIVTFLMVFLIQATQNRDTEAIQLKLDALILASKASNAIVSAEALDSKALEALKEEVRCAKESEINDLNHPPAKCGARAEKGGAGRRPTC